MSEVPKIVKRGKMTYYLYPEKVVVDVGGFQWVGYNHYDNWNRQGISKFRKAILKSKEHEYANAVDQMSLAVQCGIKGTGTHKPKEAHL